MWSPVCALHFTVMDIGSCHGIHVIFKNIWDAFYEMWAHAQYYCKTDFQNLSM